MISSLARALVASGRAPAAWTLLDLHLKREPRSLLLVLAAADTAAALDRPDDALAREYFAVPEAPDWVNQPFTLRLTQTGRDIPVAADQSATEALAAVGITVPTKCSDGICGVCAVTHQTPEGIEHRDYVLSAKERENRVILCCSRARDAEGVLSVDL